MKSPRNPVIRAIMLAASLIVLLTVVVPHHYHADGTTCIVLSDMEDADDAGCDHHHGCDWTGHNLVFSSSESQSHSLGQDITLLLTVLYTFLDYNRSALTVPLAYTAFFSAKAAFTEPLHTAWVPAAAGLRAPPFSTLH
ncbi:hypothetical protein Barb6_02747 [Bacteroidales bacterium Barb6]|nr:hypothetical protein Barb6_02747 [Bacteroidales bacterium Barb6]